MEVKNNPEKRGICCVNFAFTLIEMLMALLVASIILAAMAPVITKRYHDTTKVEKGSSSEHSALLIYDSENGIKFPKGKALESLKQTSPGVIEFTNKTSEAVELTLTVQGAGGGGGGYNRTKGITENSYSTQDVDSTTGKYFEWRVPYSASNVKVSLTGGGGGGGAANINGETLVCGSEEYTVPSSKNNNMGTLCIKKYNIGDIPSLLPSGADLSSPRDLSSYSEAQRGGIPPSTNLVPVYGANSLATNTCWYSKTSGAYNSTADLGTCNNTSGYSGCYRTLCTQDVAANACSMLSPGGQWRLPTSDEVKRWRISPSTTSAYQTIGIVTANAADFCDMDTSSYGAARCNYRYGCMGADGMGSSGGGNCNPEFFWTTPISGTATAVYRGEIGFTNTSWTSNAQSVRCVRGLFTPYYGAGGSGGGTLQNIEFKNLQYDDRLYFYIGGGGKGATTSVSAYNGVDSWVEHQRLVSGAWVKVDGTDRYTAGGGGAGGSGSTSAHGLKGTAGTCSVSQGCIAGNRGYEWAASGSNSGGASAIGVGTISSDPLTYNGVNSFNYGAGGSGGFVNDSASLGKGGNGGAGYVQVTFNRAFTGSGGGAGGYFKNEIKAIVPANSKLVFTIGKGGESITGSGGNKGGDTLVQQNTTVLYKAEGGTGGTVTIMIPLLSNTIYLANGGAGGKIYEKTTNVSDTQTLSEIAGGKATYTTGGNGGLSKSDDRDPAYGGCMQVDNPLSFSDCISDRSPSPTSPTLYVKSKNQAKGGGGGGGAGCDDAGCSSGSGGADGFVTISW